MKIKGLIKWNLFKKILLYLLDSNGPQPFRHQRRQIFHGWPGFSCCRAQTLGARAPLVAVRGLSSCDLLAVGFVGSVVVARRLWSLNSVVGAHGLRCSTAWNLPRPGIEPMSPAVAGGSLSTASLGKSSGVVLILLELVNFEKVHSFSPFYYLFL